MRQAFKIILMAAILGSFTLITQQAPGQSSEENRIFGNPFAAETETQVEEPVEEISDFDNMILSSVRVRTNRGSGSGTLINEKYVLTAYHVIRNTSEVYIEVPPYMDRIKCEVVVGGDMADLDYAILKIEDTDLEPRSPFINMGEDREDFELRHFSKVASKDSFNELRTGDEIMVCGYPQGGEFHIADGRLGTQVRGFYRTSAPIIFGNSGGGLFNEDHELVGVMVRVSLVNVRGSLGVVYHVSYATTLNKIYEDVNQKGFEEIWEGRDIEPETPEKEEGDSEESSDEPSFYEMGDGFKTIPINEINLIRNQD